MAEDSSSYIHGTDPEEQRRLATLNDLLNASSLRELALRGGERILDVGCGLAQLTRAFARAAGRVVVGVERSQEQLTSARTLARAAGEDARVDLREGDAAALPLDEREWRSFDVAHARFLLEHVPDPLLVVRGMARAVRPGGRVVLADDDHDVLRVFPEPPGFSTAWQAFVRGYDRLGNDPFVGRRLTALLHEAGATPTRITSVFFGACAGEATFPAFAANLIENLRGAREVVLGTGMLDAAALDRALAALQEWSRRPDAALWYGMAWAEGRVREA